MNAQFELDKLIANNQLCQIKPKLLLHCCCAPCASYCIDYLHHYFEITALFYNPNIMPKTEFDLRLDAFKSLLNRYKDVTPLIIQDNVSVYLNRINGLEKENEGGLRCEKCITLRLEKTASISQGFDYFATTLTVSPHKNAQRINELGNNIEKNYLEEGGAKYLPTDFKKKDGFLKSIKLSKTYHLYRQTYCGCKF